MISLSFIVIDAERWHIAYVWFNIGTNVTVVKGRPCPSPFFFYYPSLSR